MSENIKYDFDSNIKYLLEKNLYNSIENNIILQDKIMNSDSFNATFKYIEDSLNFLYEKNRVLQNVINYSNLYLKNEINNIVSECKSLLNTIEYNKDLMKDNSYIKFPVQLTSEVISSTDRNNKVIPNADIYNDKVIISSSLINAYTFNSLEIKRDDSNFNIYNSKDDLSENKTYRTFYMFNNPKNDSVSESITFKFDNAIKINKINFNTSNCLIDNITLTLDDDSELFINNSSGFFKPCYVKKVTILIKCYSYIMSQINYNDYEYDNFWDKINNIKNDENLYIDKDKFYYYLFGIDNIEFSYSVLNDDCVFISKDIDIGELKDNEYITLEAIDSIERGDIEYYIIDGTTNIPILPENKTEVINEKIFYKSELRFNYDANKPMIIKRNGKKIDITLYQAININSSTNDIYTVDYTPSTYNISKLNNTKVKIKAIIRNYDKNFNSFINNLCIKKYGGGSLWIDKI